jgi:hypothetical protein
MVLSLDGDGVRRISGAWTIPGGQSESAQDIKILKRQLLEAFMRNGSSNPKALVL